MTKSPQEPWDKALDLRLTQKTVFLTAPACSRRASEIHAFCALSSDISFTRSGSVLLSFLPEFLAKNQKPGMPSPKIEIKPLSEMASAEDAPLEGCPVRALKLYLKRTKTKRCHGLRRLFLPVSHKPMRSD